MSIHEECGVFGVCTASAAGIAREVYHGLYALQHRGQESCGIVVNDDGVFASIKDLGLVGEVFSDRELSSLSGGRMAIGHVRYGTTGGNIRSNIQPMEVRHGKGNLAIAHNGNLTNSLDLRDKLELSGAIFHSASDTEVICYMITRERLKTGSIEEAVLRAAESLEGAYSLVMMSSKNMIALRDPMGFRPLCIGKRGDGGYIVASESCALDSVGAVFLRDVEPGEMLVFSSENPEREPVDVDSEDNLIANHLAMHEIAKLIGADSLGFLPLDCLGEMSGRSEYCSACFDGVYPTAIPVDTGKDGRFS